ncbi:hypothetical protein [Enterobacter bugandensis]|uniref:hypothetical protein n=1 Tax=Enterobacter bugandensis TaxID=881260 RepID=UPI0020059E63|nr:hypothetical protein [Enterobacter bugandensis]MCK7313951.1 hypothetical protein [Enterobacter bugandensis]
MIQEDLAKAAIKKIGTLGSLAEASASKPQYKNSIKKILINQGYNIDLKILQDHKITIELASDDYLESLFTDYFFGASRISSQIENITNLINSNSQPAWVIISTYYASFFMANEISKLCGSYIINFSSEEFKALLFHARNTIPATLNIEPNNSFKVTVSPSSFADHVLLTLTKSSPRPHVEVWKNLSSIIKNLDVNDKIKQHQTLYLNICSEQESAWKLPSAIRNEWNYTYADFFGVKGTELARKFLQLMSSYSSSISWASNRTLKPHEENIVASMAYIYYVLKEATYIINERLLKKEE